MSQWWNPNQGQGALLTPQVPLNTAGTANLIQETTPATVPGAGAAGSAAVPLAIAQGVGQLAAGIFKARQAKKQAKAQLISQTAASENQINQQGIQNQNAAIESLMRKL